jgi:periplasmic mercuric ion binding protein
MKYAAILFLFASLSLSSCSSSESSAFWVRGNCEMCKETIEKAVTKVNGVESADWNQETKMLTVYYSPGSKNEKAWNEAVANAGYETKTVTATQESYDKLPKCCKKAEHQ